MQKIPLTPPVRPTMPWRVAAVEALPGYRLHIRFLDGTEGMVDLAALVTSPQAGVFAVLADVSFFHKVGIQYGAVTWPDGTDLAPDAMYDAIRAQGEYILTD